MRIAELSIRRPVLATMGVAALVVFGVVSYRTLDVSLFPDVDFPIVTVSVVYEGADPRTVESEVTDVLEEGVNTIAGIKSLRSESAEGLAQVFIEFELERDIDLASQDVRDKVAALRGELPQEVEAPVVEKFDPDAAPILAIALSGHVPLRTLTLCAEDLVKPRLEGIEGVGAVRVVGGRDREIRVWLRLADLHAYGLTAEDVGRALARDNVERPGGRIETPARELIVKTRGEIERAEEFADLVVARRAGAPIRVRDVAWVEDGMEDRRSLSRLNGVEAVSLLVRRQSGANLVAVASAVKEELEAVRRELPAGHELVIAQDLSPHVEQSLDEASTELRRGALLAVLVILFFLQSLRGAFVAALTIPTTIIGTYALMQALGFTLNMMSMLALSLSVGMIIDDSIVVLENSYRHLEAGKGRMEAALAGIAEIGFAVIVTSLAIAAVFVPVAYMKGLVGRFFFEFGLTVSGAVALSTFVALTLSPTLCARLLVVQQARGRLLRALEAMLHGLESAYRAALRFALRRRLLIIGAAAAFFAGSLALTPFIGKEFVPAQDEGQFNVQVEVPLGSSLEACGRILAAIEQRMAALPHVADLYTTIGAGEEGRVNVATLLVKLEDKSRRHLGQQEIMARARAALVDLTHLKTSVELVPRVSGGGFRAAAIQYCLRGQDLERLEELADQFMARLRGVPGIVDVNTTYDARKPEVAVNPDRERAADLGIDAEALGTTVRALIGGWTVTTFEEGGERHDVRLRLAESDRDRPESIRALPLRAASGELVRLDALAEVEETTGPVRIERQDRERQITIMANVVPGKPLAAALDDLARLEREIGLPPGVHSAVTGFGDLMRESFASIQASLVLAIVLIYMILAAQFESLIHPFTIMLSLPLSVGGALGALLLTGRTLNIFSMIGMVMLMGLVTKNAILLVDFANRLRGQGLERDAALLEAGPIRLRPILMTALSTIAGMLPIVVGLGAGAETRAPMGTCVVGGLVTSTLLTLIVVPAVYSVLDDLGRWIVRLAGRVRPRRVAR